MKRIVSLMLTIALLLCCIPFSGLAIAETSNNDVVGTLNNTVIAYVPLDNRPVNLDRAEYLAEASGITLLMPNEDDVSTTLSVEGYTSDGGDPRDVFAWLKTTAKDADYYVLSVDMLFSGGLVGSRDPFYDTNDSIASQNLDLGNYSLSAEELEIVEYIAALSKEKPVILFDTVMRLASTNAYGTWDMGTYNFFRYQYSLEDRKDLTGSNLTIDKIVGAYKVDPNGTPLSTLFNKVTSNYTGYGKDYKSHEDLYCRARERKLRISDALYSKCYGNLAEVFIGVDDSMPTETIQSNEIKYLTQNYIKAEGFIKNQGVNRTALLFAGADELGLMGIASAVTKIHGEINVKVRYFGGGKDWAADDYDHESLSNNVDKHIDGSGATQDASKTTDMEILVLTRAIEGLDADIFHPNWDTYSAEGAAAHKTNISNLITRLKYNLENNIPTCVIDGSSYQGYGPLADAMLAANINLTEILGFSAWNTTGNATGIALGNAIARAAYLKNYGSQRTIASDTAFLSTIAYSYIKDDAYKKAGGAKCKTSPSYFYNEADLWLAGLNASNEILIGIENGVGITAAPPVDLRVANLHFPWHRDFEADFDIQYVASNNDVNIMKSLNRVNIESTYDWKNNVLIVDNFDSFVQGDWWWGSPGELMNRNDTNSPPYASWFYNGAGLIDGITYSGFGDKNLARTQWYGMAGRVPNAGVTDDTPETNAKDGVCNIPSIKFKQARDLDQIKIHFLYYVGGAVYLPEKVVVTLYDAAGNKIDTIEEENIRAAEGVTVADGETYWLNMTFDQIYENVSTIMIRPHIIQRNSANYQQLYGWCLMDEIEVYGSTPHVHTYDSVVTEPTCTEKGFTTHTCSVCGDSYTDSETQANGHTPGDEADCENDQICTVCGDVLEKATGHTPGDEADCENDQVCTVCGDVLEEATGHTPSDWIDGDSSTPDQDGYRYKECTVCGELLEKEPISIEKLAFSGASLTLESSLVINYKVNQSLFDEVGYTNPYVVFTFNGETITVTDYRIVDGKYVFDFVNINPHFMNDTVYSTLYATYNGTVYSSETKEYSVAQYCYNTLDNYSSDTYAELRTLLVDLLNYGAASQLYMDYKIDNLVNANLTETQKAWGTSDDRTLTTHQETQYETISNPTVLWKGAGLNLQTSVGMRFRFDAESVENLTVKITNQAGQELNVTSDKFEVAANGEYYVFFDKYSAAQMSEVVYVTVYEGDTAVSHTIRYSIESYAYSQQNNANAELAELVKEMMKYGDSAKAYITD